MGSHPPSEPGPVVCFQVGIYIYSKLYTLKYFQTKHFPGLFDQLLNAMNDDSSDDEAPAPGPGPSGAGDRTASSGAFSNKKLEQADLD